HLVFSTKGRQGWITDKIEERLHKYIGGIVRGKKGALLEINGMPDHVHLLLHLKPTHHLPDIVRDIKANSSAWLNEQLQLQKFGWQDGYSIFSVSQSQAPRVKAYIQRQKVHHLRQDYQSELLTLLRANEIGYDERYLWT